jgi:hypothetical protein
MNDNAGPDINYEKSRRKMLAMMGVGGATGLATLLGTRGAAHASPADLPGGVVDITDFGAKIDGTTDDSGAINAAIRALPRPGGLVIIPYGQNGRCSIESTITIPGGWDVNIRHHGVRIAGIGSGRIYSNPRFVWNGPLGGTMMKVEDRAHGAAIENLVFDANDTADNCLYVEALAGSSTHDSYLSRLHFEDYRRCGLILGEDTDVLRNGQLRIVTADHLVFRGGPGNPIGVFLNAQNAEFVNFFSPMFGPRRDRPHAHHICQRSGGIQVFGMVTDNAVNHGIYSATQLCVYGWRSEDRYLVQQRANAGGGPSTFMNVHQRNIGENEADDWVFDLKLSESPQTFQSVRIQGSIRIGPTAPRHVNAQGVKFELPGAGFVLSKPQNLRGILHDSEVGSWMLRGVSPSIDFRTETGAAQAGALTGVKGISALAVESNNLRGIVTISGKETFADVTFDVAEPDADYHVVATVNTVVGNVPPPARIIHISHQATTGFHINLAAPPGGDDRVTIAWILVR